MIDKAREHLGLSDLEKHTEDGGVLHVHIGDALSTSSNIPGGYAGNFIIVNQLNIIYFHCCFISEFFSGIVIDLFSGGEVLAQLQEV